MAKPRLAWFATTKSGSLSAYATARYLGPLAETFEIVHFIGDDEKGEGTLSYATSYELQRNNPFDVFLYCLERNSASDFAWESLGVFPGIALMLEDFAPSQRPWLFQSSYLETIQLLEGKADTISLEDREPYPVDAEVRAALLATKIIVISEEALERIPLEARHKCAVIPLPVILDSMEPPVPPRAIAIATPPHEDFLCSKIFLALKNSNYTGTVHWIISGLAEENAVKNKAKEWELGRGIDFHFHEHNVATWQQVLQISSLILHLQSWGRATLEPFLGLSLLSGRPVVVTNFGIGRLLNERIALRITVGMSAGQQLRELFKMIPDLNLSEREHQSELAMARYAPGQSVGELRRLLLDQAGEQHAVQRRLNEIRQKTRQSWVLAVSEELRKTEYGGSFRKVSISSGNFS